ncbi:MAG: hypothetical protein ABIT96_00015 [Ferruginibacter sp.]
MISLVTGYTTEQERRKKALIYTAVICVAILLLFILISWTVKPVSEPVIMDLMEINLGNNETGFGDEQPLIKGQKSPTQDASIAPRKMSAPSPEEQKIEPDENAEEQAAAIDKVVKKSPKTNTNVSAPVTAPSPKPQKPKITYNGPGNGSGNNSERDNGYTMQGNDRNGKGDDGDPNGHPDSYGKTPGGKIGGPKVFGNRRIIKYYSFVGDLPKATINAIVNVSPGGTGTFVSFDKGSTSRSNDYAEAIRQYLRNISFDKSAESSRVMVQFNFNVQ